MVFPLLYRRQIVTPHGLSCEGVLSLGLLPMGCFRVSDNLPTPEEILGLPERTVTPVEEEDLGLIDLF
jgi:hypothetical protein